MILLLLVMSSGNWAGGRWSAVSCRCFGPSESCYAVIKSCCGTIYSSYAVSCNSYALDSTNYAVKKYCCGMKLCSYAVELSCYAVKCFSFAVDRCCYAVI